MKAAVLILYIAGSLCFLAGSCMALVHATCDLITTEHSGDCMRGSKRHTACNALNCQAYAIAMRQREKILETFGLPTGVKL